MLGEKYIGLTTYLIKSKSSDLKMSFKEVKKKMMIICQNQRTNMYNDRRTIQKYIQKHLDG